MNAREMAARFVPTAKTKIVEIPDEAGETVQFTIARFAGVAEMGAISELSQARLGVFEAKKRLEVVVPVEMAAGLEEFLGETATADGKLSFYLTAKQEVVLATHMEKILIEPSMTWGEACLFVKTAGIAATKLLQEWERFNVKIALDEAKNG